jgi:hypothetical protein
VIWNIGLVNEYEVQRAIISFVGIIIRKQYELPQQCHFVFISRRVATPKESGLQSAIKCAAYSSEPVLVLSGK